MGRPGCFVLRWGPLALGLTGSCSDRDMFKVFMLISRCGSGQAHARWISAARGVQRRKQQMSKLRSAAQSCTAAVPACLRYVVRLTTPSTTCHATFQPSCYCVGRDGRGRQGWRDGGGYKNSCSQGSGGWHGGTAAGGDDQRHQRVLSKRRGAGNAQLQGGRPPGAACAGERARSLPAGA